MIKFFKDLFSDNNQINEKSFVGFVAFCCMIVALLTDLITGWLGKELIINEFIFDGFMMITLGAFGIGSIDKFINAKKGNKTNSSDSEEYSE
jgi:ABC-type uncharacterized transport system permease subunit